MSKTVRNVLIGSGVAFVLGTLLVLDGGEGWIGPMMCLVVGGAVFYGLQARKGTTPEIQGSAEERAMALRAAAPPGGALLFVSRTGFLGKLIGFDVSLDGVGFAQLRSPRFTSIAIETGAHVLSAKISGRPVSKRTSAMVGFTAAEGEVLLFEVDMRLGVVLNTLELTRLTATVGVLQQLAAVPMVRSTPLPRAEISAGVVPEMR